MEVASLARTRRDKAGAASADASGTTKMHVPIRYIALYVFRDDPYIYLCHRVHLKKLHVNAQDRVRKLADEIDTVYVQGLHPSTSQNEIKQFFGSIGTILTKKGKGEWVYLYKSMLYH